MASSIRNSVSSCEEIVVVGISGRMVASMLFDAGFHPTVIDFFADRDTQEICNGRVRRIESFAAVLKFEELFRRADAAVFSGGLEGACDVAAKISRWTFPAFANPNSLRRLNRIGTLNEAMKAAGIDRFPFLTEPDAQGQHFAWKQLSRSGSCQKLLHHRNKPAPSGESACWQRWIEGASVSAVFVASQSGVRILGVTEQLIAKTRWVGSVLCPILSENESTAALSFASAVANCTGLTGVFGIDFIRDTDGVWPIDVNPRIPASAELLGADVLQAHLSAFGFRGSAAAENRKSKPTIMGKQVMFNCSQSPVYIRTDLSELFPMLHSGSNSPVQVADVPNTGSSILPGHPVLSVLATEGEISKTKQCLEYSIAKIRDYLLTQ